MRQIAADEPARAKDEKVVRLGVATAVCGREYEFADDDPRASCHLGLHRLELAKCQHCTWYGLRRASSQMLHGEPAIRVLAASAELGLLP